jgi:hypothetical protein
MKKRASTSTVPSLTREDAAVVKGMLKRGDRQSDIASFFGVNGGRIADINTEKKWHEVEIALPEHLPPAGPYLAGRSALKARDTLIALRDLINYALSTIDLFEEVE